MYSVLRQLVATGLLWLIACAIGWSQPDSLRRLSPARRYVVVKEAYHQALSKDTTAGKRLRRELEAFFRKKGTDRDRLLLQMAFLDAERHNRFHTERILPWATALLRRAEADRDTVLTALAHLNIGSTTTATRSTTTWRSGTTGRRSPSCGTEPTPIFLSATIRCTCWPLPVTLFSITREPSN